MDGVFARNQSAEPDRSHLSYMGAMARSTEYRFPQPDREGRVGEEAAFRFRSAEWRGARSKGIWGTVVKSRYRYVIYLSVYGFGLKRFRDENHITSVMAKPL